MSATSGKKSQGMKFAEEQMHKHGWKEGKGLGRRENGISEAIKVKVKCDNSGVGHNPAEQFTFHWWDHVFNKTASSISVEADQEGVKVNRVKDEDSPLTNKKPRKAFSNKNMLYGRFVKSATLLSGGEQDEPPSSENSDRSGDEDEKLDLSSANKLTDEQLNKVCGGRTAHKGARHGLTMNAKLSRLEEQEREFLAKYGKKEEKNKERDGTRERTEGFPVKNKQQKDSKECTETNISHESSQHKKKKKKKKRKRVDSERKEEESQENCHEEEQVPSSEQEVKLSKKKSKKKHREESPSPQEEQTGESTTDFCIKLKKKKKKSE